MGISCVSEITYALLASKYKLQWKNMHVLFSAWASFILCLWCIFSSWFVPYSASSVPCRKEVLFYSEGRYSVSECFNSASGWIINSPLTVCFLFEYLSRYIGNLKISFSIKMFCPCWISHKRKKENISYWLQCRIIFSLRTWIAVIWLEIEIN